MSEDPTIGVSACLLGEAVRYDGGHKRCAFLIETLSSCVRFRSFCPETAIGLGVPRPPIHLVGDPLRPHAVGVANPKLDVTLPLEAYARSQIEQFEGLSGCVLKKDSPSCGRKRVKLYDADGTRAVRKGTGIFARVLMQDCPLLPVEDEGALEDPILRENFVNRVYVYHRWQKLLEQGLSSDRLLEFHSTHRFLIMAHSRIACRWLGQLLSDLAEDQLEVAKDAYVEGLMHTLKRRCSRKQHASTLQQIIDYLKRRSDTHDEREIGAGIAAYRRGEIPLARPIGLLRHHLREDSDPYLEKQWYLHPYPDELGLRDGI